MVLCLLFIGTTFISAESVLISKETFATLQLTRRRKVYVRLYVFA